MPLGGLECPQAGLGSGGIDLRPIMTGVILSIVADCVVAFSLFVTKLAHNRNWDEVNKRQRKPYIRVPLWWTGIVLNVIGEVGNLIAYGFAPALVVTPVGSVGVLCNAIFATWFLKEPLRVRDVWGCAAIICGVVLIVLGVPQATAARSPRRPRRPPLPPHT